MRDIKVMVTRMPENRGECPFSVFDCEYGYRCKLDKENPGLCSINCGYECEYLIAPFEKGEKNDEENPYNIVLLNNEC